MSARITNYKIVSIKSFGDVPTHEALQDAVNQMIAEGYQPLGRPFFNENSMYQALVKYSESTSPTSSDTARETDQRWLRASVSGEARRG